MTLPFRTLYRKMLLLSIILPQVLSSLAQTHHEKQEEDGATFISAGAGGLYGTGPGKGAANFRGYYNIGAQKLCFGPELSIFQKSRAHGSSFRLIELGLIGHYIFHLTPHSGLYPLTGPNLSIERTRADHGDPHIERIWGWNTGAGVHFAYGNWAPFAEWKYIFGKAQQQVFAVGLICNFR